MEEEESQDLSSKLARWHQVMMSAVQTAKLAVTSCKMWIRSSRIALTSVSSHISASYPMVEARSFGRPLVNSKPMLSLIVPNSVAIFVLEMSINTWRDTSCKNISKKIAQTFRSSAKSVIRNISGLNSQIINALRTSIWRSCICFTSMLSTTSQTNSFSIEDRRRDLVSAQNISALKSIELLELLTLRVWLYRTKRAQHASASDAKM